MSEPMTRVLHELCTEIDEVRAEMKREIDWRDQAIATEKRRHSETTSSWTRDKDRLRQVTDHRDQLSAQVPELKNEVRDIRDELDRWQGRVSDAATVATNRYNRLALDLYHYIVELAGYRDTAKTKAERVALGHVVQRLAEIRGMNDTEQEAVA